jgi:hypothetical protein
MTGMHKRVLFLVVLMLGACGASAQQQTLHATYIGVKAAEAGFVAWDRAHQQELVEQADSLAAGVEALHAYRMKREPVLHAFIVCYQLLYVALADTTNERVNAAIRAAAVLYDLIELIRKPDPPPTTTMLDRPREGLARIKAKRKSPELALEGGMWP